MRTDVKLGVVISLAIVLVAGGYYVYRDQQHEPIPMAPGPDGSLHAAKSAQPSGPIPHTAKREPRATGMDRRTTKRNVGSSSATRGTSAGMPGAPTSQPQQKRLATADRSKRTPPQGARKPEPRSAHTKGHTGKTAKRKDPPSTRPAATASNKPAGAKPAPTKQAARERIADGGDDAARKPDDRTKRSGQLDKKASQRGPVTPPGESPRTADRQRTAKNRTLAAARKGAEEKPGATTRAATPRDATSPDAAVDIHRVQPGDTFSSLAAMYYGDVKYTQFLVERNAAVGDPKRLVVGMEIRIPALPVKKDAPPAANPVVKAASKTSTNPKGKTYTVKPGDTFYAIARDTLGDATRWRELLKLNTRLVKGDPTRLQVGQVITLPD
ncbi:MAG: LysM peptidoglycan-binding domain-containing protein [Planctomycetes bacterium]|nr:LysM peptidoglycan-binding domain-containing protein [Planctomycetota bacterium]